MGLNIKKKNKLGQNLCYECLKVLDSINHQNGKYTCRECVKVKTQKKKLENSQRDLLITHQKCTGLCGLELTIDKFEKTSINNFRGECILCRNQKRKTTTISRDILEKSVQGLSKSCKTCGIEKVIIENFSTNGNTYRTVCKICRNQHSRLYNHS